MILTAVINVHKEGLWARKAIRSAYAALEKFAPGEAEIVVVADRADEATLKVAEEATRPHSPVPLSVVAVDVGDLGRARNHGVMAARGRFVAFLDGDDVWGEDWPTLGAAQLARECDALGCEEAVAHPFLNVDFGDNSFWWTQPDQRDDGPNGFDMSTFWNTNCWSSGAMAPRSLLQQHPYRSRTEGLGFEDWEWNARTLAAGVLHVSVPKAVVFIRKKNDGLNAESAQKRQLAAHSAYFENRPEVWPRHKAAPYDREALRVDEAWLLPQWRAAHRIEPALWPDARNMRGLPRYRAVPAPNVASVALAIADKLQASPTHLILAPCLVKGGADKRVVAYAEAALRAGGRPLVLLTDRDDDPSWAENMPEGVRAINVSGMLKGAGTDAGILGLARLAMRFRPVVHVVNSRTGYALVASFGASLRDSGVPKIFCSLYGSEEDRGRLGGAAFNGWFFEVHKHVDRVISDNAAHLAELHDVHGWPFDKTTIAPSPVASLDPIRLEELRQARRASRAKIGGALRVLWASRMVRGKRLDRLLATARLAHEKKLPILFACAGEPADDFSAAIVKELRALPNVKVSAKAFDGWAALAPEKHDVFMFTSETEGMPNVVLEALSMGLPVVSTFVGDVARCPSVKVCPEPDSAAAWLEHLQQALPAAGAEWVREQHSIKRFDDALAGACYFDNIDQGRV